MAALGLEAVVAPTLMHTVEDAAALAKVALAAVAGPNGNGSLDNDGSASGT